MRLAHWDQQQQESLDRAMAVVDQMSDDERRNVIENALRASIAYATSQKHELLQDYARGLLTTIRTRASGAYDKAIAGHLSPDRSRSPINLSARLASLRH